MSAAVPAAPSAPGAPGATGAVAGAISGWWVTCGAVFVILGGLVAAVTGPLALPRGSWLAAYLVLVCGVPQYLIGRGTLRPGVLRAGWPSLVAWNAGNAAVIVGTLLTAPYVVDVGGVLLLLVLVALLVSLLRRRPAVGERRAAGVRRWLLIGFLLALTVSIPIGLVLAHLRAG